MNGTSEEKREEEAAEGRSDIRGGAGQQGVRDLMERVFLAGIGAAALTKDRIQELVDDLVKRGHLDAEEGRDMVERLAERSREEARAALKKADTSLQGLYRDLGLATRRDLEDMDLRLRQLELRVQLLERAADEQSPSGISG